MKRTPLYDEHLKLKARIVEFGGWEMPVFYTNVIDEHKTTRTKAGLFDICHMGEFIVRGKQAAEFVQCIITNDINKLTEGKAFYTAMCNEQGGVVDDLFVYKMSESEFMLVVNAGNIEKDFLWLKKHINSYDVELKDVSERTAKLDLQGPNSEAILQKMVNYDLSRLERFHFVKIKVDGILATVSRTGYTGEDGFELYFDSAHAKEIWNSILLKGKELGIKPIGLGARDTLRIEACYSLYGHELSEGLSPFEAGTGFVVKLDKPAFVGKAALERIKDKSSRNIVAFEMIDKGVPRQGYEVFFGEERVGAVTSGTMSPTLQKGLGLALMDVNVLLGSEILINIRHKLYKAKIVKRPFYSYKGG
ncbi:MAG: glycine cleavage system aminomethyltransferase GcvT [Nanoarchaeota archaeon]|nr:glycine cleavage system aminomethyltransferase GcvT [Nanoarchaeota archaeon]MBU1705089.1 glycine cleavage system aminomethyltransferase GcvT [Nanoarchaeota archaeon]